MKKKVIGEWRFDDAAALREALDAMLSGERAEEIYADDGPSCIRLIEETLSDGSKVRNFAFRLMTEEQIRREKGISK